jgi:hypothetical protein
MRLWVRKAKIEPELRTAFEQYGAVTMQGILAKGDTFRLRGTSVPVEEHREALLSWLTEHSDREEWKETRQFLLEVLVIILIGIEIRYSRVQLQHERELFNEQKAEFVLQQQAQQQTIQLLTTAGTALNTLSENVKAQEAAQKAQQRRRPAFELCVKTPRHGGCAPVGSQPYFPSDQSEYSTRAIASVIFDLSNTGDKDATNVKLGLTAEPEYTLECQEVTVEKLPKPVEGGSVRILANLGTIRAGNHKPVRCFATKGGSVIDYVRYLVHIEADQLPPDGLSFGRALILNSHDPSVIKNLPTY